MEDQKVIEEQIRSDLIRIFGDAEAYDELFENLIVTHAVTAYSLDVLAELLLLGSVEEKMKNWGKLRQFIDLCYYYTVMQKEIVEDSISFFETGKYGKRILPYAWRIYWNDEHTELVREPMHVSKPIYIKKIGRNHRTIDDLLNNIEETLRIHEKLRNALVKCLVEKGQSLITVEWLPRNILQLIELSMRYDQRVKHAKGLLKVSIEHD